MLMEDWLALAFFLFLSGTAVLLFSRKWGKVILAVAFGALAGVAVAWVVMPGMESRAILPFFAPAGSLCALLAAIRLKLVKASERGPLMTGTLRFLVLGLVVIILVYAGIRTNRDTLIANHVTSVARARLLYSVHVPSAQAEDIIFANIRPEEHLALLELMLSKPRSDRLHRVQPLSQILAKLYDASLYARPDLLPHAIGMLASRSGSEKELLDMIAGRTGWTNPDLAAILLGHGISPNLQVEEGRPPLIYSLSGSTPTPYTFMLLRAGADPDVPNQYGETIMTLATRQGDLEFMLLLAEYGASLDVTDNEGMTLLHHAAIEGRPECMRELLSKGLEVDARDEDGVTPLMYAMHGGGAQMLRLLQRYTLLPNMRAPGGMTPLHLALDNDFALPNTGRYLKSSVASPEAAGMLLTAGADPLATDKRGWSVVHYTLTSMRFLSYRETVDRIETLLRAGADPTLRCDRGFTPLGQVRAVAPDARYIPDDIAEAFSRVGYPVENLW